MPKSKKSQNSQKKRNLSSPDNGRGQPEKRTPVKNTMSSQKSSQVQNSVNSLNSSGFIQPMNGNFLYSIATAVLTSGS